MKTGGSLKSHFFIFSENGLSTLENGACDLHIFFVIMKYEIQMYTVKKIANTVMDIEFPFHAKGTPLPRDMSVVLCTRSCPCNCVHTQI